MGSTYIITINTIGAALCFITSLVLFIYHRVKNSPQNILGFYFLVVGFHINHQQHIEGIEAISSFGGSPAVIFIFWLLNYIALFLKIYNYIFFYYIIINIYTKNIINNIK